MMKGTSNSVHTTFTLADFPDAEPENIQPSSMSLAGAAGLLTGAKSCVLSVGGSRPLNLN